MKTFENLCSKLPQTNDSDGMSNAQWREQIQRLFRLLSTISH